MKLDEFAFVNQQLAGMLKSGIPLEGALRQLCETMRRGTLRSELELLETDLSKGTPLSEALAHRKLPPFYVQMVLVGVQSNDLPGVLTLLADYYQRTNSIWTRLKGLMVYPLIVLFASLALSISVAVIYGRFMHESLGQFTGVFGTLSGIPSPMGLAVILWLPVMLLGLVSLGVLGALSIPGWRRALSWRLPAFKEASLCQLASALRLMLQNGCTLNQALELVKQIEAGTPAQVEIGHWQARLAAGYKKFSELTSGGKVIPPMFVWLVAGSGEDWMSGFKHAAEIYYGRAAHKIEMLLYAVLPVSILVLGILILMQVTPMLRLFFGLMNGLSSTEGMGE